MLSIYNTKNKQIIDSWNKFSFEKDITYEKYDAILYKLEHFDPSTYITSDSTEINFLCNNKQKNFWSKLRKVIKQKDT